MERGTYGGELAERLKVVYLDGGGPIVSKVSGSVENTVGWKWATVVDIWLIPTTKI